MTHVHASHHIHNAVNGSDPWTFRIYVVLAIVYVVSVGYAIWYDWRQRTR